LTSGVNLDDFIDGITASLRIEGVQMIDFECVDSAFEDHFPAECELRFHLELSPFTLKTQTGRIAMDRAVERGVLQHDPLNKQWTIQLSEPEAKKIIQRSCCAAELWKQASNHMA
jgi:hypothetical protein